MSYPEYNLSICAVDSSIYAFICNDKIRVLNYLLTYDHEGTVISLVKRISPEEFVMFRGEDVYDELDSEFRTKKKEP